MLIAGVVAAGIGLYWFFSSDHRANTLKQDDPEEKQEGDRD